MGAAQSKGVWLIQLALKAKAHSRRKQPSESQTPQAMASEHLDLWASLSSCGLFDVFRVCLYRSQFWRKKPVLRTRFSGSERFPRTLQNLWGDRSAATFCRTFHIVKFLFRLCWGKVLQNLWGSAEPWESSPTFRPCKFFSQSWPSKALYNKLSIGMPQRRSSTSISITFSFLVTFWLLSLALLSPKLVLRVPLETHTHTCPKSFLMAHWLHNLKSVTSLCCNLFP